MNHTELTKNRPPKEQSDRREYIASIVTRGTIYHKGLGMRNGPLPGSVEVQHTVYNDNTV